jgi:zinc/manganese transport system substrate-binding protein
MKTCIATLLMCMSLGWSHSVLATDVQVVASFTVLADMARQIGGNHARVRSLVGPNGDPHVYEPTPQDGEALAKAKVIFVSGLGLEGWMDRLIRASGTKGTVVVTSAGIPTRRMMEDGKEIADPHAWNSAANGIVYAENITRALIQADRDHAAYYRARGNAYEAQLRELDTWARAAVGHIPTARRTVITNHDAFGYMGAAYGIRFLAPIGFSTESEPSASAVAGLIDQIRHTHIHAVFLENSNDPRLVEQIASEAGIRPGGTLYPEALSTEDGPASTYASMFRHNIETLLQGMSPH